MLTKLTLKILKHIFKKILQSISETKYVTRDDWKIPKTKIPDTVKFPKYKNSELGNSRKFYITELENSQILKYPTL